MSLRENMTENYINIQTMVLQYTLRLVVARQQEQEESTYKLFQNIKQQ